MPGQVEGAGWVGAGQSPKGTVNAFMTWLFDLSGGCSPPQVTQHGAGSAFSRADSLRTTWI